MDTADVCIIGAGLAGGLLAYELSSRGVDVVMLEAGPRHDPGKRFASMQRSLDGLAPWSGWPERDRFSNAGTYAYPLNEMRVKGVGGSTLHWNGVALRMHSSDFALRRRCGVGEDWPITYDDLEPYYVRAETRLGVAGAADNPFAAERSAAYALPPFPPSYGDEIVRRAGARRNIAFHGVPYARNSVPWQGRPACQAFGTCSSDHKVCPIRALYTAETHVDLSLQTGHATLFSDACVVRLNRGAQRSVQSATWMDPEHREHEQAARVFVLAAHAVESARLLLLSTSGDFPDGLANGSGAVGKYFMEHPTLYTNGMLKESVFPHRIGFHTAESQQFCVPPDRDVAAGFKLEVVDHDGPTPAEIAMQSGTWGKALLEEVRESFGRRLTLLAMCEQLPEARNTVTLDPVLRDTFGDPAPCLTYGFGAYEESRRGHAVATMSGVLEELGAGKISSSLPGEFGICAHHLGTCRMGDDPATSVVDRNLRCHDVANLFVVGGSVFVTSSTVNPSLTIAALALRLADFLRPA